jgi:hypothetical protein
MQAHLPVESKVGAVCIKACLAQSCWRIRRFAHLIRLLGFDLFLQVFGFAFDLFSLGKEANGGRKRHDGENNS